MCACTGTRHQLIYQWLPPDARPTGIRPHLNAWPGYIKRPSKNAHGKVVGLSHGQPMLLPPALLRSSFDHHITPCSPPLPPPLPCSFPLPHQLARPHNSFSLPRYTANIKGWISSVATAKAIVMASPSLLPAICVKIQTQFGATLLQLARFKITDTCASVFDPFSNLTSAKLTV